MSSLPAFTFWAASTASLGRSIYTFNLQGWRDAVVGFEINVIALAADRVFVVFRGRIYKDPPTWLTVPYFLWSRLQRELGLAAQAAPLLSVIATASGVCPLSTCSTIRSRPRGVSRAFLCTFIRFS